MKHYANLTALSLLALCCAGHGSPTARINSQGLHIRTDPRAVVSHEAPGRHFFNPDELLDPRLSPSAADPPKLAPIGPVKTNVAKRSNIGPDDRALTPSQEWPWRLVGRVTTPNSTCTGSLVGPRHVLTAGHCVGQALAAVRFAPGYDHGEPQGGSNVISTFNYKIAGAGVDECHDFWDFVILILEDRIGENIGRWFHLREFDNATHLDKPMFAHAGYPGDLDSGERMYWQWSIRSLHAGVCNGAWIISTDADSAGGQSGGPLWLSDPGDNVEVYGVHTIANPNETFFSGGRPMVALLELALAAWP